MKSVQTMLSTRTPNISWKYWWKFIYQPTFKR